MMADGLSSPASPVSLSQRQRTVGAFVKAELDRGADGAEITNQGEASIGLPLNDVQHTNHHTINHPDIVSNSLYLSEEVITESFIRVKTSHCLMSMIIN